MDVIRQMPEVFIVPSWVLNLRSGLAERRSIQYCSARIVLLERIGQKTHAFRAGVRLGGGLWGCPPSK